jgi:hypothetical protein
VPLSRQPGYEFDAGIVLQDMPEPRRLLEIYSAPK